MRRRTYAHTCIDAYMSSYIHTFIPSYIHTFVRTYVCMHSVCAIHVPMPIHVHNISSSNDCSPPPDSMLWRPIFPRVFVSRRVFLSHRRRYRGSAFLVPWPHLGRRAASGGARSCWRASACFSHAHAPRPSAACSPPPPAHSRFPQVQIWNRGPSTREL